MMVATPGRSSNSPLPRAIPPRGCWIWDSPTSSLLVTVSCPPPPHTSIPRASVPSSRMTVESLGKASPFSLSKTTAMKWAILAALRPSTPDPLLRPRSPVHRRPRGLCSGLHRRAYQLPGIFRALSNDGRREKLDHPALYHLLEVGACVRAPRGDTG